MKPTSDHPTRPPISASGLRDVELGRYPVLGDGRMKTTLRADGSGGICCDGQAIIRWRDPSLTAHDGLFVYVRDVATGCFWSAGWQPVPPDAAGCSEYHCQVAAERISITRTEYQLRTQLCVAVGPAQAIDLRLVQLTNESGQRRTIELTSYAEIVLQPAGAFESHPVFSKLFLETHYEPATGQLIARRRTRGPDERSLLAAAWIVRDPDQANAPIEWETDRERFMGRGRTLARPTALAVSDPLSGTVGGVLDPIFALRTRRTLDPGESATVIYALAASYDLDDLKARAESLTFQQARAACTPGQGTGSASGDNHAPVPAGAAARRSSKCGAPTVFIPLRAGGRQAQPHCSPASAGIATTDDESPAGHSAREEPALFANGLGGFRADGREYVIELRPDANGNLKLPPRPWTHVIANRRCGVIATERGAICSWVGNSRENRLTPWSNDPIVDPCHELIFLREKASGVYWSPLPGPMENACAATVRYGFGYAEYQKTCHDLIHETTLFVPPEDPLRLIRVTVTNTASHARDLEFFTYHPWVLGNGDLESKPSIHTEWDSSRSAMLARRNGRPMRKGDCAFSKIVAGPGAGVPDFTGNSEAFLGPAGDLAAPAAVCETAALDGAVGSHLHPCAGLRVALTVPPQGSVTVWHLLGEAESADEARVLLDRYANAATADQALCDSRAFWDETLGKIQVDTPSPILNVMLNGWLVYQNIVCRLWGRSSYYQGGGAIGFRDQLQDACALRFLQPDWTRQQILLHAEHQFAEGDVLHWWHPSHGPGLRTRFSDDLLWLPYVALEYAESTGDHAIWSVELPFCAGPELDAAEQERLMETHPTPERATLYDHCCRAFDRSQPVGQHGLPLIGCGDWNDGFSRVGVRGRGESVWLACFLCYLLPRFISRCEARGDSHRANQYAAWYARLQSALEEHGWDGQWYRRAYLDNGEPLGSAGNDECRIDALVQAWAILAGVASGARAAQIMQCVQEQLVDEQAGVIRLLTPAFDSEARDVGYIRGYVAGVRENGGQYTHGVLWFIRALAEQGDPDEAIRLLEMISPVSHASSATRVATYRGEPYVVAADIYGEPPHTGRAGWTWYTGSAGWMYRVALESILGLRSIAGEYLQLKPCLPKSWPGFRLFYALPDDATRYQIEVKRIDPASGQAPGAWLDGEPVAIRDGQVNIPRVRDGGAHHVIVQI